MNTYFILVEVTQGYGSFLLGFVFVSALVLYRNKLLSTFRSALPTNLNLNYIHKVSGAQAAIKAFKSL